MTRREVLLLAAGSFLASLGHAQELVAEIEQGTNMALALAPDGETIVVDLVGQLWELPVTGGGALPLTPLDEPVRNPRFSPDGRRLVYQRALAGRWDLWILDLANGTRHQLTGAPFNEREPDFSPDGDSVVFASDRAGSYDIWELDLGSGELSQLTRATGHAAFPTMSERGDVAFVNNRGTIWSLEVLRPNGETLRVVESPGSLHAPSWRPGGGVLLYTEQHGGLASDLKMILLSDEPVIKTLTQDEDVFGFRPAWLSPGEYLYTSDGRIWKRGIANTVRSPVAMFAGVGVTRANHTLRVSGHAPEGPQQVRGIRGARLAPSGRQRAFTALGDLWLQTDSGDLRQLTNDAYIDIDPSFGPNEDLLVFASDRAGDMDLWQIGLVDNELIQLSTEPGKSYGPSVSPDGTRVAFLHTYGFGPWNRSSLRVMRLDTSEPAQILADGLIDASAPRWVADGAGLIVTLPEPPPELRRGQDAGALQIDIPSGVRSWIPDPRFAEATLPAAPELGSPTIDWTPADSPAKYVVQVDRLFDGIRTQYRRHMDIHVADGRITDIVARGILPLPDDVIDARDRTIIPGLIDLHAHQSALGGERLGRIWLAYGVTTVREIDSHSEDALERREAWSSGRRLGPRLLLTSARASDYRSPGVSRPSYDVLQLYSNRADRFAGPTLPEARALGLPVFSERLLPAARYGINGLEHIGSRSLQPYDLERSALNKTYQDVLTILTRTRASVTPTLAAFGGWDRLAARQRSWRTDPVYTELYHDYERDQWQGPADARRVPGLQRTIVELIRAGGRITAGSDAPAVPYGLGLHAELALLAEAGLANDQILRIATADAALALGLERDLGTLEAGKLADFVVLSGDPLARIGDSLRIEATAKDGVWLERDQLMAPH